MGIPEQLKLAMEQEQMGKRSCTYKFNFSVILPISCNCDIYSFENVKMMYV